MGLNSLGELRFASRQPLGCCFGVGRTDVDSGELPLQRLTKGGSFGFGHGQIGLLLRKVLSRSGRRRHATLLRPVQGLHRLIQLCGEGVVRPDNLPDTALEVRGLLISRITGRGGRGGEFFSLPSDVGVRQRVVDHLPAGRLAGDGGYFAEMFIRRDPLSGYLIKLPRASSPGKLTWHSRQVAEFVGSIEKSSCGRA